MKTKNNAIDALVKKCKELKHHAMFTKFIKKKIKKINRVDETWKKKNKTKNNIA